MYNNAQQSAAKITQNWTKLCDIIPLYKFGRIAFTTFFSYAIIPIGEKRKLSKKATPCWRMELPSARKFFPISFPYKDSVSQRCYKMQQLISIVNKVNLLKFA